MKVVRFSSVVEKAGKPAPYLSWVPVEKDQELRKLLKQDRIMTVHQELRGPRKDYGTVGLHREGGADQILVFPKSLRRFNDRKVVGLNYDLIASESHNAGPRVRSRPAPKPQAFAPPPARKAAVSARPVLPPKSEGGPALSRDALLREIRKAVGELKAGKTVAAYERLEALV